MRASRAGRLAEGQRCAIAVSLSPKSRFSRRACTRRYVLRAHAPHRGGGGRPGGGTGPSNRRGCASRGG
eukprot:3629867-Prymnesium_polylepis.1